MIFLWIYLWLAVTTAIVGLTDLIYPVVKDQKELTGKPVPYEIALYAGCFAAFILIAPIVLVCYLVPTLGWTFRTSLAKELFPKP